MSVKHVPGPLILLLALLTAALCAAPAGASPAGPSGVRPFVEGEEPATLEKPADQNTPAGSTIPSLAIEGKELVQLKAERLPAGLELKKVTVTEWQITGAPTTIAAATSVTLTAENPGHGAPAVTNFNWTVVGANNPGPQTGTAGVPLEVPIHGVELTKLTAVKALPAGLELEDPGSSEFEWRIVGTPSAAGESEVELEVDTAAGETQLLKFTITIAAAPIPPPAPPAPIATGQLAVSPSGAFSAARSSCGGVSFSTGTVTTQWLLDGLPIAGATSASYIAPRVDDGHLLSCLETATAANGTVAQLASPGALVHEQPPQPVWPIGPASGHCAAALCMEDGNSAETPPSRTYQQGGSWLAASQVRCVSAPWTSIAGNSTLATVAGFAEAHAVSVTLQRVTPAGVTTLASEQLRALGASADGLDGSFADSPFAGQIALGYGAEAFTAGELWARAEPGSLGKPDRFAAGQGYLAYQLAAGPGVKRSFQLLYNLTGADLGARLRCVVSAEDGPAGGATGATLTSAEYSVAKSSACAPRRIAHIGGPQPAVVLIGSRRCLSAQAGLVEIGGELPDVSSVAGRSAFALECALAPGCSGRLALASAGHRLASVKVSLRRNARRVVSLKLGAHGRSLLRRAGAGGLPVTLTLAGGSSRLLLAAKLLNLT